MKNIPFGIEADLKENTSSSISLFNTMVLQYFIYLNLDIFQILNKKLFVQEFDLLKYETKQQLIKELSENDRLVGSEWLRGISILYGLKILTFE